MLAKGPSAGRAEEESFRCAEVDEAPPLLPGLAMARAYNLSSRSRLACFDKLLISLTLRIARLFASIMSLRAELGVGLIVPPCAAIITCFILELRPRAP